MSKDNKEFFKIKNRWSVIKDSLLECYLRPYFQKLMSSNKPICYIDCFAGKGKFEDGKDGSPLIALNIINQCLQTPNPRHNDREIEAYFIESKYANELTKNIREQRLNYKTIGQVVSGKFEKEIGRLLQNKENKNIFLYIDPYGIKSLDANLFCSFNGETYGFRTIEMLINFNSFGVLRCACAAMKVDISGDEAFRDLEEIVEFIPTEISATSKLTALVNKILGGNYWKNIVQDLNRGKINGYQAEMLLSLKYKERLRQNFRYVLDMPIRLKPDQRPKYRMVHACNHADGCFLMAQNMLKRKEELFINIQQGGQLQITDIMPEYYTLSVEGEPITREEAEKKIEWALMQISKRKKQIDLTEFLAFFMTYFGLICDFEMIYSILKNMESSNKITVIRDPALTDGGRNTKFWALGNGKKITMQLRRNKNENN